MDYDRFSAEGLANKRAREEKERVDKQNAAMFADVTLLVDFGWGWQPHLTRWHICGSNEQAEAEVARQEKQLLEDFDSHGLSYKWEVTRAGVLNGGEVRPY